MNTIENDRPGGAMASRPLHFIWLADCSSSMTSDGKIQALNEAIREATPHMREAAHDNPQAEVMVRAITFSSTAQWHIAEPTPINDFSWKDVSAHGATAMGEALSLVAKELQMPPMSQRALPPVLVLISDGYPTDNIDRGLQDLFAQAWGIKAVRLAIPIGEDHQVEVLQRFINNPEIQPIFARNPEQLKAQIKFFSTSVLKSVASSPSRHQDDSGANVIIPDHALALDTSQPSSAGEVW